MVSKSGTELKCYLAVTVQVKYKMIRNALPRNILKLPFCYYFMKQCRKSEIKVPSASGLPLV